MKSVGFARSAYRCNNRFRSDAAFGLYLWAKRYLRTKVKQRK